MGLQESRRATDRVRRRAKLIGASASSVSQHLAKLRLAGPVTVRREGTFAYYIATDAHVRRLLDEALFHALSTQRTRSPTANLTIIGALRKSALRPEHQQTSVRCVIHHVDASGSVGWLLRVRHDNSHGSLTAGSAAASNRRQHRDWKRHRNVIRNDRRTSRDVPIQFEASDGEPPQQPEVFQGNPRVEVVRDRPLITSRGFRFKSCAAPGNAGVRVGSLADQRQRPRDLGPVRWC